MRLGPDVTAMAYASPSGATLNVNTLLDNNAGRISPSLSHQQPYGSRPGSPMTIRAFEALTEAVAAVDAQAAHEASLSSPNALTSAGSSGGVARRAWNMQPNNSLGPLTSLSRTSSRGMDSPVSAERSGLLDDEEEESDEYMAAAAAHLPSSSTRHLAGANVLSSSRDGSPIGSSLEYFDRRMGGSGIARSTSGAVAASGRGGSKLRDMDIDMDATLTRVDSQNPASSDYPQDDAATPQLDASRNPQHDPLLDSSMATPSAAEPSSLPQPPPGDAPIASEREDTPTKLQQEADAVPRIAFQQVQ